MTPSSPSILTPGIFAGFMKEAPLVSAFELGAAIESTRGIQFADGILDQPRLAFLQDTLADLGVAITCLFDAGRPSSGAVPLGGGGGFLLQWDSGFDPGQGPVSRDGLAWLDTVPPFARPFRPQGVSLFFADLPCLVDWRARLHAHCLNLGIPAALAARSPSRI